MALNLRDDPTEEEEEEDIIYDDELSNSHSLLASVQEYSSRPGTPAAEAEAEEEAPLAELLECGECGKRRHFPGRELAIEMAREHLQTEELPEEAWRVLEMLDGPAEAEANGQVVSAELARGRADADDASHASSDVASDGASDVRPGQRIAGFSCADCFWTPWLAACDEEEESWMQVGGTRFTLESVRYSRDVERVWGGLLGACAAAPTAPAAPLCARVPRTTSLPFTSPSSQHTTHARVLLPSKYPSV